MMCPDSKSNKCNSETSKYYCGITKEWFSGKCREYFRNNTKGRKY